MDSQSPRQGSLCTPHSGRRSSGSLPCVPNPAWRRNTSGTPNRLSVEIRAWIRLPENGGRARKCGKGLWTLLNQSPSRFYRSWALLPSLLVLISLLCRPLSAETAPFILEKGDLPILLVAPHGGSGSLLEAPIRRQRDSEDPHFSTKKDMVTSELTRSYCDEILKVTGKKPSLLSSEIHRKYCDLNREEEWSSPAPAGQAFHREYHGVLRDELKRLVDLHGWALLLDIHGQSSEPHDLMIGVREGDTIGDWSKAALWGNDGLVERLQKEGFAVVPGRAQEKIRYGGGYSENLRRQRQGGSLATRTRQFAALRPGEKPGLCPDLRPGSRGQFRDTAQNKSEHWKLN